jgi:hypothetical protein
MSAHSAWILMKPRKRNWRKPRACLIWPITGSTVCLRRRWRERRPAVVGHAGGRAGLGPLGRRNAAETPVPRSSLMQKLQAQGVHHITLVGAIAGLDRFSGRACWACLRLRAAQPRCAGKATSIFDRGDGP